MRNYEVGHFLTPRMSIKNRKNITRTMSQIYGTGQFNPSRFDRTSRNGNRRAYIWGLGLFIFAVALTIGFGFYLFSRTPNSFTGDRVHITITEPETVVVGDELVYLINVQNNENRDLDNMNIFIQFPDATASSTAVFVKSSPNPISEANNTWRLGTVKQGETAILALTLRLSGDKDTNITLPIQATFEPRDFKTEFSVTQDVVLTLGSPLVSVQIEGPSAVSIGSEVALQVHITGAETLPSNTANDMVLHMQLPKDLEVISYDPPPLTENGTTWRLSDLRSEDGTYELLLRARVATGAIGSLVVGSTMQNVAGTLFAQKTFTLTVQNSRASLSLEATPAQGQKLQWGESVRYAVVLHNTGSAVMRDVVVSVQLSGEELWQQNSVVVEKGGFVEAGMIFWDAKTTNALASVRPDSAVTLAFSVVTQKIPPQSFTGTPALLVKAGARATIDSEELVIESPEIVTKILATIELDATAWYTSPEGIQWGSGNNPPLAGSETTYALLWSLGPSSGELTNLLVSAELPSGVVWKNETEVSVGEIAYDANTRIVTWRASRVPKLALPFAIRFMVGITPAGQTTNATPLLGRTSFSAIDAQTGEQMELYSTGLTIGSVR